MRNNNTVFLDENAHCKCPSCSEDALKELVDYTNARKDRLMKLTVKGSSTEDNSECIRLAREWDLTKRAITRARQKLASEARNIEAARREFGKEMDKEISEAYIKLTMDLIGAARSAKGRNLRAVIEEVAAAIVAFNVWRNKYNSKLPPRISSHLSRVMIGYQSALELVRDELENEKKITSRMSKLRCANF